ncbi:hypothetical protein AXF42_Ash017068 [Apostasia shenzhenica]|uniref:Aspartic peptidase DDI1-type domain-containing protein n=1 Tax=Apostasia shenzhenica TaxID=1088818 RepID=A0A2I0B7L4_9ASPA|nr:hypothetical protein AXF42_Ash017068 [Apostasia shenzhenica]
MIQTEELENTEEKQPEEENLEEQKAAHLSLHAITGIPSYSTMAVKGKLGIHEIHTLIDSGSTHNFVDPGILKGVEGKCEIVSNQLVKLATGVILNTQQVVRGLKWKMYGKEFLTDAMVLPLTRSAVAVYVGSN